MCNQCSAAIELELKLKMQVMSRFRLFNFHLFSTFPQSTKLPYSFPKIPFSQNSYPKNPRFSIHAFTPKTFKSSATTSESAASILAKKVLFMAPGVEPEDITEDMILPGSNIVVGPYAGDSKIKEVEFVKSSNKPKDCPKDEKPEFAMLGRSNVGKSSLINALCKKKEVALTSKKPGLDFCNVVLIIWSPFALVEFKYPFVSIYVT